MYSERGGGGSGSGSGPGGGPVDSGAGVRSRGARRDLSENVNRDAISESMDVFFLISTKNLNGPSFEH